MYKIHKFGGSNFINKEVFESFYKILSSFKGKSLIIISALGKTTRRLYESVNLASINKLDESLKILEKLEYFTQNIIEAIFENDAFKKECVEFVSNLFIELDNLYRNIAIFQELTPRTLDLVLSYGEQISATIFQQFLHSKNFQFKFISAQELITTDNNFTKANPLEELINVNIHKFLIPIFAENNVVLTQGFIGKTKDGETTTMGFESSNLTALIFASSLNSPEITIWTDVEGIYNIDPHFFSSARQIPILKFSDAIQSADFGSKIFYPHMLIEAEKQGMTIFYKSIINPVQHFTEISPRASEKQKLITISDKVFNVYSQNTAYAKIENLLIYEKQNSNFIVKHNNSFNFFTDNFKVIEQFEGANEQIDVYSVINLINYNVLDIYKIILNYSDLFINFDYKLYQMNDSVLSIFLKKIENQALLKIIEILTNI